jgi:hypothetical protein
VAVVAALNSRDVAKERLTPVGASFASPVASNKTDEAGPRTGGSNWWRTRLGAVRVDSSRPHGAGGSSRFSGGPHMTVKHAVATFAWLVLVALIGFLGLVA